MKNPELENHGAGSPADYYYGSSAIYSLMLQFYLYLIRSPKDIFRSKILMVLFKIQNCSNTIFSTVANKKIQLL